MSCADHAAVQRPDPVGLPVARLHHPDDLLQRRHVRAVAGKDLVAQGHATAAHHQRDIHLLAVRPVVSRVTALRQRIRRRFSFEVGAGDVVQQQVVVEFEQLAQPFLQVLLECLLVGQQLIERSVQSVFVDFLRGHAQQLRQRTGLIGVLGQVQLAGGLAQPPEHQDQRHQRPGNLLTPGRNRPLEKLHQPQSTAQLQAQPRPAELAAALDHDPLEIHLDPLWFRAVEEAALPGSVSGIGSLSHSQAASLIHLAQIGYHPLARTARGAVGLHQRPIGMALAILPTVAAPQVHTAILRISALFSRGLVFTTRDFASRPRRLRMTGDGNKRTLSCFMRNQPAGRAQKS